MTSKSHSGNTHADIVEAIVHLLDGLASHPCFVRVLKVVAIVAIGLASAPTTTTTTKTAPNIAIAHPDSVQFEMLVELFVLGEIEQ